MQTHIAALILVVVIIGCINVAVCEGPWCYDCDKAAKPGSCGEIIKCKDDEQCYASSTGISPTQYTAGCRKKQLCQGTGSVAGGSSPHGCEECCIGDHCNSKLCGGLPVPMGGNRLCLQCEAVLHPSQCSTVSKCGQDKYCSIWKRRRFQMTFYDLGCLEKTKCEGHMKGVDELSHGGFICCNDDLCNSHENNNHLTPAPTQPATTTSQPETTIRTGNIKCKKCAFVQQPAFCSSETECGPDQYCSVREVFRFGLAFYDLGCEEKTACVGHMKTLGERGFRCCNEERCNANVNPVTGRTTPAITTPATTETSASPTKTASLPPTTTIGRGNIKCKKCASVERPSFCSSETECGPDQYCSVRKVFKFGIAFFDLGCEEKTECVGHMTTLGEAGFRCCNEDRCNANVNPVTGSTVPSVTTPSSPETTTPSATSSYLPTMAPDIMNTNQTVNVIAGKTVLLLCNVTGNPEPSVTWTYNKQGNPNAHPKGSTLAISSVNEKNEGIYRCVANNTLGTKEGIVHLHVIEPVSVKGEPPILVISPGMRIVRLKCVGEGIPPPSVTLSKYGEDISADKSYAHLRPAEILIMGITEANVLKYDGVYVCNATNGHTSASAYQIVAGNVTRMLAENVPFNNISTTPLKAFHALCPPGSTQPDSSPITTEFDLGEPVCTSARKVGLIDTDAGSVTWLIRPNGKALFLNGSMTVDLEQLSTTSIPLTTTMASSLASSTATSSLPLIAPDISNTNQTVNAILGETVLLFCNVSGNPTPSVTWEYDKSVSPNAHPKESTLAISSIVKKNEGIYKCVANNSQGIKEAIVHVHVTEPVSVKGEPPIVVISPGMRIARLKCVGEGIPPPSVTLNKYGEDITTDKSYLHSGPAEILIMRITEANLLKYDGVYVCNATNGHTSASAYQIVAINVTTPVDGHVPFNNISTTPLKAFHAMCPPGLTGPDGSPITHEFNLDEVVCTSARKVGIIDTNPGPVTWLIRPDGKAQFLNGSLSVDLGQVNSSSVITTPSTSVNVTSTLSTMLSQPLSMQPSTISNIQSIESLITAFSHTISIMATPASYATHVPLASILAPSSNVITSHSSEAVTSSSQSLFLSPSTTAPESSSHTMLMASFSSSFTSPSIASGGTYASSKDMSSSEELFFSSSQTVAITSLLSSIISSEASAGAPTSSKGALSWMVSSSPSPTLAMTSLQSKMISSSQPSAGTYASSKAVSSMLSSETLPYPSSETVAMVSLPSSIVSSEASAGTTVSSKRASSGIMSSSPSPTLASSKASAGTYASSRGVSSSGMESNSPSPGLEITSVPSSMISSPETSTGTDASSKGVSSSGMASSSSSLVLEMTPVPTGMISSPETSTGAYASSRGVSSSMSSSESLPNSSSQTVAMTSRPSTMIALSEASAGTYASSKGVSSSGMESNSPSPGLEITSVPTSMISSPETSTVTDASLKGASSGMVSSSPSPTLAMTSLPSTMIASSEASAGTYASSKGVSSSGMESNSPSPGLEITSVPTSMISSPETSTGTDASSKGASSKMVSSSPSPTLAMTSLPSTMIASSEASAGTYASSKSVSSSGMATSSSSLVLEMTSVPTGMISSSEVSTGIYASSKGESSSVMRSNSPSPNLAMTSLPSTMISSSDLSAGSYSSSEGVSSSGMGSNSPSPTLAMTSVPTSMIVSSQASAVTYASTKDVSSSGMASSSSSPALEMTSVPTSIISPPEASAGTYASSKGESSSVMRSNSPSPNLAMTSLPSTMISSSDLSAGSYSSSEGVSSSGMGSNSPSPTLAMTSVPTSMIASSQASAVTYASTKDVSSSGMASSSSSPALEMTSVPTSIISPPEASAGTYASSKGVSSSGMASSSSSPALEMTPVPTSMISSPEASAGTYASSMGASLYGMGSNSPSPTLGMTSVERSTMSSSEASAGTYASSMGASLYGMGSNSPSPTLGMTSAERSTMSSSEASAGTYSSSRRESASESLPSSSTTLSSSVPASSVSSAAYLLPSQSSVNQMLSSHPTVSPSGSISFTSFLPTPTSSRVPLPAAVTSSLISTAITSLPSASALLSHIISPSSSLLSPGQSSVIPGTYKQEPTTEGTTITTTIPGVAPSISNPSQNVNASFGENVILSCDVTGVPQPSVTWYYNTQDIYNAKPDGNNLSLAYVTNDNTGDYTCVAENSVGVANGTIHVQINKPITISVAKPIVVLEPDSFTQLLCKTKVQPPPTFTWSKYGGRLDLSTDPTIVDFGDGEMLLTGVNKTNIHQYEGIYICHADNGVSTNEAYVVAAGNITKTLDNSKKFSEIGMKPGEAFHAICVPGTVDADGSSLPTRFASTDSICDSARRVGVLAKDAGPVTWFIRLDGKAEFVNETKGAVLSIADAPTTRDVPTSQLPDKATTVKASLSCETCSGPRCGMVPGSDTQCPSMTPFCMTTINTKADGRKSVTKSCASVNDCETKWWQLTSDDNKCEKLVPGNPYYQDFTCSYCCTESGCNEGGIPKKDTLYKGNI